MILDRFGRNCRSMSKEYSDLEGDETELLSLIEIPEQRTQTVEAVPFGYCVGEYFWVGMAVGRIQLDIELVCEDFFGVAGKDLD